MKKKLLILISMKKMIAVLLSAAAACAWPQLYKWDSSEGLPTESSLLANDASGSTFDFRFQDNRSETVENIKLLRGLGRNDYPAVDVSLIDGADCNVSFSESGKRTTPLHYAVENCTSDIVGLLLKNGASVTETDSAGYTPLTLAIHRKKYSVVDLFISNNTSVNAKDRNGKTALMYAVENGDKDVCAKMVAASRPSELAVQDNKGRTALHYAVNGGWVAIATKLVESGMDNTIEDNSGYTAFMRALDRDTNMIDVFVNDRFFNVNKKNSSGLPPLLWAIKSGKSLSVIKEIFCDRRCTISASRDSYGYDALDYQKKYQPNNKELKKYLKNKK